MRFLVPLLDVLSSFEYSGQQSNSYTQRRRRHPAIDRTRAEIGRKSLIGASVKATLLADPLPSKTKDAEVRRGTDLSGPEPPSGTPVLRKAARSVHQIGA